MVNLIEKASTSMSLGIGKFLGSRDRVAIAGNCPQARYYLSKDAVSPAIMYYSFD